MRRTSNLFVLNWKQRARLSTIVAFIHIIFEGAWSATLVNSPFYLEGAIITLIPVAWALFLLFSYRESKERFVAWMAFVYAIFALLMGSDNLFAFFYD